MPKLTDRAVERFAELLDADAKLHHLVGTFGQTGLKGEKGKTETLRFRLAEMLETIQDAVYDTIENSPASRNRSGRRDFPG